MRFLGFGTIWQSGQIQLIVLHRLIFVIHAASGLGQVEHGIRIFRISLRRFLEASINPCSPRGSGKTATVDVICGQFRVVNQTARTIGDPGVAVALKIHVVEFVPAGTFTCGSGSRRQPASRALASRPLPVLKCPQERDCRPRWISSVSAPHPALVAKQERRCPACYPADKYCSPSGPLSPRVA